MIFLYVQRYTDLKIFKIFRFVLPLCYSYLYREIKKPNVLLASNVIDFIPNWMKIRHLIQEILGSSVDILTVQRNRPG
jgi:hypothetical protein